MGVGRVLERFTGLVSPEDPLWREALPRVEHDFYHLPAYAELCARRDGGKPVAFIHQAADATLLLPLILLPIEGSSGHYQATCPYGYPGLTASPGATPEALAEGLNGLVTSLQRARAVTLFSRLHPLIHLPLEPLTEHGALVLHGETVSIDLRAELEQSWSVMRASHRRHIVSAQRAGYAATIGWERLDAYLECYDETMRRVSAHEQYLFDRAYVDGMRQVLGDRLHLCTVSLGGQVACAGLFSEVGGIMQYHLGGTKDAYLVDSPMKLMFDHVRRWGHERGNRVLHLGGGVGGRADALYHFKAGFSDRRHPFRTYRVITDEAQYARLCAQSGVPAERDGYFPAFARASTGSVDSPPQPV